MQPVFRINLCTANTRRSFTENIGNVVDTVTAIGDISVAVVVDAIAADPVTATGVAVVGASDVIIIIISFINKES
jgi:hypothetical protein